MKAISDFGRPALKYWNRDEFGETHEVIHVLDIDTARKLRDELTEVIKHCVIMEAVQTDKRRPAVGTTDNSLNETSSASTKESAKAEDGK